MVAITPFTKNAMRLDSALLAAQTADSLGDAYRRHMQSLTG
jgi:hypothetical protein